MTKKKFSELTIGCWIEFNKAGKNDFHFREVCCITDVTRDGVILEDKVGVWKNYEDWSLSREPFIRRIWDIGKKRYKYYDKQR